MSHKRTEFEIEQQIFLGGQISNKIKEFQKIAELSPDYAEIYLFLDKLEEFIKIENPIELLKKIINLMGQVDMVRYTTELTRLSMVMGDTTKHYRDEG